VIEAFEYMRIRLTAMAKTERGASAVEYGLLVALIAVVCIGAVTTLGTSIAGMFNGVSTAINNATP
jgi:pilus assembly protein Flp/PilA